MMMLNWPTFVLQRRVNVPISSVERLLCSPHVFRGGAEFDLHADRMYLRLDRPFGVTFPPFGVDGASWSASATVRSVRRGRQLVALEVEINAWDPASTEVVVRPRARRPYRWGPRRLRRYFRVAHLTADVVTQVINTHSSSTPSKLRLTSLTPSVRT
jgi:hypothetical protein